MYERGFVVEDGVILHLTRARPRENEYLLTSAEPNLAWFADRIGRLDVRISDVSEELAALAVQGPRSREVVARLVPQIERLPYFGVVTGEVDGGGDGGAQVIVSRTGFTGDLGYELWVGAGDALPVWDALWQRAAGYGVQPFGLAALRMLRIEAGLLMLGVDFDSSRYAWNDAHRATPLELGWGWMVPDLSRDDRAFVGRRALERELAQRASRWALRGLVVDWQDYDRVYNDAGLVPPKQHTPVTEDMMVYDDAHIRVGYATSFLYSPVLQRHIAIARVRPDLAASGTTLKLEFTVNHGYEKVAAHVAPLPLFNPERRTT